MATAATAYPLLGLMWTMLILFGFALWFWLVFVMFGDLFGRTDLSPLAKAGWMAVLILVPILGVLAYLVARGTGLGAGRREETR
ncbi:PLDc N-terminal domain-containing protein [Pseudonocardia xinjiangensis]|uniref:PLDc N-terminal domain-containing protein n=1 Tax=Pseudonocardia xinjiangensis TaxID=75289 RepID=UPI003D8C60D8